MSDRYCLLSVFHFLLIKNDIAIDADTNRTNTMSQRPSIEDVQYVYNEPSTFFFRLSACWEDDKDFLSAQLYSSLYQKKSQNVFFCLMLGRLFLWSLAYPINVQQSK
jgi:hypothetical protein